MSAAEYYNHSTFPAANAAGSSSAMRAELELIEAGFGKLPDMATKGGFLVIVNSAGTALESVGAIAQGFSATSYNAGTKSSGTFTPDPAQGNMQHCVNGGAFTLAPPASSTSIILEILNNASAGAITTSGFTKVVGAFATTDTYKYVCSIIKTESYSLLQIQEMQ